jgi:2,3-bisphosphoglycerate-dependent phosphoglycerate mutase
LSTKSIIKELDVIYSSWQTKALQTAIYIAKDNQIPIKTDSRLTEVTSITNKFIEDFEVAVSKLYSGEIERLNGGESMSEAKERFNNAIQDIVNVESGKKNIGIVAHGNVLSLFASQFQDIPPFEIHKKLKMPDVAILDWEQKSFIKFFGDSYD